MANKPGFGRDFDRDKNLTYRPQDESGELPYHPLLVDTPRQESIVAIILDQHHQLRELTVVLKYPKWNKDEKQTALLEFINLWSAHAQAEENALYDEVMFSADVQNQIDAALDEHAMAQTLIDDLEALNFRITWSLDIEKKAKALAEVVESHMSTEEDSYLKLIQDLLPLEEQLLLGREFSRQFEAIASHNRASLKPSRI